MYYTTLGSYASMRAGLQSYILQKVSIPIVESNQCSQLHGWQDDGIICAGVGNYDTCRGDSGGPLSCSIFDSNIGRKWFLRGITSFGDEICGGGHPAAYADVEKFTDWIILTMYTYEITQYPFSKPN